MKTHNPYLVKKTVDLEKTITVQEELEMIDWTLVPSGTFMTGKIHDIEVEGVLFKDEADVKNTRFYFCQNEKDGSDAPFKFGYEHSWAFEQNKDGSHSSGVTDIQFPPKPADFVLPPIPPQPVQMMVGEYSSVIHVDHIIVGCQTITKETVLEVLAKMEELAKLAEQTK